MASFKSKEVVKILQKLGFLQKRQTGQAESSEDGGGL